MRLHSISQCNLESVQFALEQSSCVLMDNSVRDQMLGCEKKSLMSQPSDVCLLVYSECEPACLSCLQDLVRLLWPLHVGGAAVVFPLCLAGSHLGADRPLAAHGRCVSMPLLCVCVCRKRM